MNHHATTNHFHPTKQIIGPPNQVCGGGWSANRDMCGTGPRCMSVFVCRHWGGQCVWTPSCVHSNSLARSGDCTVHIRGGILYHSQLPCHTTGKVLFNERNFHDVKVDDLIWVIFCGEFTNKHFTYDILMKTHLECSANKEVSQDLSEFLLLTVHLFK